MTRSKSDSLYTGLTSYYVHYYRRIKTHL